jgi:nucleotide-binding universal stress UspA family protein
MSPPLQVLVPVDGSAFGRRGLLSVCGLLDPVRYAVTLLRVAPLPDHVAPPPPRPLVMDGWPRMVDSYASGSDREMAEHPLFANQVWETTRTELMDEMDREVQCLRDAGFDVALEVRFGHPADEIVARIAEGDFALVAMATHGRSGLQRALLGSVAEQVVRRSVTPVLLTRPPAGGAPA